jgi:hypothetical protein
MSAESRKVGIQGVTEIQGEKVFALRFLQDRNPDWRQRPFFASLMRMRLGWMTSNQLSESLSFSLKNNSGG